MSYLALYRKYRPSSFDEMYGQSYIVNIIKNAVLNDRISHAYLFSGPRGTGKTTMAKLISKIVNCENLDGFNPCEECNSCKLINDKSNPDVVEIDAASNNGVDEIREIKSKVSLMPSVSKYKVYIIDEVHMLSIGAFNALLKTLEEPPKHVIFILATTELYKVPETIISRCQCYEFERISVSNIVGCLKNIVDKENLNVDDEVLEGIAKYCNGGMRDSISLLDKLCSCSDDVTLELFYDVVGFVSDDVIGNIVNYIFDGDIKNLFALIENLERNGKNILILVEQIMKYLKNSVVNDIEGYISEEVLLVIDGLSNVLLSIKNSTNILLSFEVGILKIVNNLNQSRNNITNKNFINFNENKFAKNSETVENKENVNSSLNFEKTEVNKKDEIVEVDFSVVINNAFALADKNLKQDIVSKWKGFYDYVHNKEFAMIVSYFLDSTIQVAGEKDVIISAEYDSVVINASKNIVKLELLFNLVMGKYYNIAFVLDSEWDKLKEKYISSIKEGKKYEYIEPNKKIDDIIVVEDNSLSDTVLSAKEIFGSDIVEIK